MPSRMAMIPVRDTAPERALLAAVRRLHDGPVTMNDAGLPGSPDVVLPGQRVAAFAHGCFWHHHAGCRHARVPATSFPWIEKFRRTQARDAARRADLLHAGWRVLTVWECALVGRKSLPAEALDLRLRAFLDGAHPSLEIKGGVLGSRQDAA